MEHSKRDIRALTKDELREFFLVTKLLEAQVYEWLWQKIGSYF